MNSWFDYRKWFLENKKFLYNDNLIDDKFYCYYESKSDKHYYEFVPSDYTLALVESIAEKKAEYTNNRNQDEISRELKLKINKQFEGCLAELAVAKYLINIIGELPKNVKVYDSERKDFYYNSEEYDVKVMKNDIQKYCEVRCSWSYQTTIQQFLDGYGDIIGKYTNSTKKEEELADFFVRPVLHIDEYKGSKPPQNAIELVKNKKARLLIIAACCKDKMTAEGIVNPKMTKNNTEFKTIKINKLPDIINFKGEYDKLFL